MADGGKGVAGRFPGRVFPNVLTLSQAQSNPVKVVSYRHPSRSERDCASSFATAMEDELADKSARLAGRLGTGDGPSPLQAGLATISPAAGAKYLRVGAKANPEVGWLDGVGRPLGVVRLC
jgi:hypothetical protein